MLFCAHPLAHYSQRDVDFTFDHFSLDSDNNYLPFIQYSLCTILKTLYTSHLLIQRYNTLNIFIPVPHMRKLRLRKFKQLGSSQTSVMWQNHISKSHVPNQCSMHPLLTFVFFICNCIRYFPFMYNAQFYKIYFYLLLSEIKPQGIAYLFRAILF